MSSNVICASPHAGGCGLVREWGAGKASARSLHKLSINYLQLFGAPIETDAGYAYRNHEPQINADERRFVASAFICILEANLAKDAVRLQADAGYDRTFWAACLGRRMSWRVWNN